MANENLTPQQRAALFGAATRQHFQMLGSQTISGEGQMVQFRVPKVRILNSIRLHVKGTITATHATTTSLSLPNNLTYYDIFRLITLDFNNGFRPVSVSGRQLALNNMLYPQPGMIVNNASGGTNCKGPASLTVSSTGADNDFEFILEVPLSLNHRDPVGLILAQNQETTIDLNLDVNTMNKMFDQSTITLALKTLKISPMAETFSVPSDTRAFPDMSVLKILDSKTEPVLQGENRIKLQTGMIYRKMIFCLEDTSGTAFADSDITSNIEIILNTADTPYSVSPEMLRAIDRQQAGIEMPAGVYYLSLDWQGINGYGGSRDYIDTERVTTMEVRFTAGKAGKLTIISEKLSRLISSN